MSISEGLTMSSTDHRYSYFMHGDDHAGISAFINRSAAHWDRNALMLAVGALVPLENGRLGRSWKHAERLKELAECVTQRPSLVSIAS